MSIEDAFCHISTAGLSDKLRCPRLLIIFDFTFGDFLTGYL